MITKELFRLRTQMMKGRALTESQQFELLVLMCQLSTRVDSLAKASFVQREAAHKESQALPRLSKSKQQTGREN